MELRTVSQEETTALGERMATLLHEGAIITLEGDLGAGKTTFTKGIGKGLGIKRAVNSPTFTIMKVYESGRLPLYHIDAYRLEGLHQDLGFEEYIYGDGVCVIEWAAFVEELLPKERLNIKLEYEEEGARRITLTPYGEKYDKIVEELGR